jgi:predicted acyltransferase
MQTAIEQLKGPEPAAKPLPDERTQPARLACLDALRGFDMFWIMGGDLILRSLPKIHDCPATRWFAIQMEHCAWAGFHFYDLIFPLFVFLVGASIAFSVPRMIERSGHAAAIQRILIRSVILFLLGVIYMGGLSTGFKNVYLAGVLHRIAVAYFFAALLFCFVRPRALAVICLALLIGYWALMTFVPVPGIGMPDLSQPGHNIAHYLDQRFLPGQKFEGTLLSTMAAVSNCLLGIFAGLLLKMSRFEPGQKVRILLGCGILSVTLGFIWGIKFPIIKLLWTSSYVLVSCGYGAVLLAFFYLVIEIWNIRAWAQPFIWMGMNAITVYVTANVVSFQRLAWRFCGGDVKAALGSSAELLHALLTTLFAFLLARYLYRRKIFLRI